MTADKKSVKKLPLKGDLTIQNAAELKKKLTSAFKNNTSIVIEHSDITRFDVTYIQMLYACCKKAEKEGKELKITFDDKEYVSDFLQQLGIKENNELFELVNKK